MIRQGREDTGPESGKPSGSVARRPCVRMTSAGPTDQVWLTQERRPPGVDDATVTATGKLSEAVEWIERARGALYEFHQLSGRADLLVGEAAEELAEAGHAAQADRLKTELVGRNVIDGRWTFQIVEEYDATYWRVARELREAIESDLLDGMPHVYESELKESRRSAGLRHHEARPASRESDNDHPPSTDRTRSS